MLASSEVMDALKGIGLNKYERNLWVALLRKGVASAGELAEISHVPRSRCYDVLESLADKGFVIVQPSKPIKYVAIEPSEALERAKLKELEKADELSKKIDKLKKSVVTKELKQIHKEGMEITSPEEIGGALKGRDSMHQQLSTMVKNAKKSIKVVTTAEGLAELADMQTRNLKKAANAGVDIKILAPLSTANKEAVKVLSKYAKIQDITKTQHIDKMVARIALVDGRESVIALTHDKNTHPTQDIHFWSQSGHATSQMFEPMFNMMWESSKKVR